MVVMAGEAGVVRKILGGVDAREAAEVVNEMGLIEIATILSYIGPTNSAAGTDVTENRLEAANTAEKFRGQSDVILEELDEAARAETGFGDNFGDVGGLRGAEKSFDGEFHSRMIVEDTSSAFDKREFDGAEFCEGRGSFENAIAELAGQGSPEVGEREM
jgi:hypothetical protein